MKKILMIIFLVVLLNSCWDNENALFLDNKSKIDSWSILTNGLKDNNFDIKNKFNTKTDTWTNSWLVLSDNKIEIINKNFAKDKNNIYQIKDQCDYLSDKFIKLEGADIDSFRVVWEFWIDKNWIYNVYVEFDPNNIDFNTFKFIKIDYTSNWKCKNCYSWYYRDKNNIFEYYREYPTQECNRLVFSNKKRDNNESLKKVLWAEYNTYTKYSDYFYSTRWKEVYSSIYKDKNYYFLFWNKIPFSNSGKDFFNIWNDYYYNNWNIYKLGFDIKIIKRNFSRDNLNNIIIEEFWCWPWDIQKDMFFSIDEYNKFKKSFNCDDY